MLLLYGGIGAVAGAGAKFLQAGYQYSNYKLEQENWFKSQDGHLGELPLYFPASNHDENLLLSHAREAVNQICDQTRCSNLDDFDERYFAPLDINLQNFKDTYGNFYNFSAPCHFNSSYYDQDKKTIDWEGLAVRIYENGKETAKEDESVVAFSLPKVQEKLENMKCLLVKIQNDFPDFDVAELACKLEDYQFFTHVDTILQSGNYEALASTSYDRIIYSPLEEEWSRDYARITDYHEDFHLFANSCVDKMYHYESSRNGDGIGVFNPMYLDQDVVDENCFSRYQYSFLEEIYAELYSTQILGEEQEVYLSNDEVLNVIQLVLAMDEDYSVDEILEDLLYQQPLSFIRHFPVYGEDKDMYLMETCQMLKSFDVLLGADGSYFEQLEAQGLQVTDGVSQLKRQAFSHLSSLFFNQLIVMNESYSSQMTLDDNFAMINLFYTCLNRANIAINYHMTAMEQTARLGNVFNNSSFQDDRNVFFSYLSKEYKMDEKEVFKEYVRYDVREDYNFPMFDGDKQAYYHQLLTCRQGVLDPSSIPIQTHNKVYSLRSK